MAVAVGRLVGVELDGDVAAVVGHHVLGGLELHDARLIGGVGVGVLDVGSLLGAVDVDVGVEGVRAQAHDGCHVKGVAADRGGVHAAHRDAVERLGGQGLDGVYTLGGAGSPYQRRGCQSGAKRERETCGYDRKRDAPSAHIERIVLLALSHWKSSPDRATACICIVRDTLYRFVTLRIVMGIFSN